MQAEFHCFGCGESFWEFERFTRHACRRDTGTALHNNGRKRLTSLLEEAECPDPPRLDG